ncbi:MAG: UDP-3-O-(3-hydroxymyristoyl)glucosamine N-acyltransferase [Planctomycetota bacterium]
MADGDRSVAGLAMLVGAVLEAPAGFDASVTFESLDVVERAGPRSLTFVGNGRYARLLESSLALAAVVSADIELTDAARNRAILRVKSADHAMIAILERFAQPERLPEPGIDPSARVHPTAEIGEGARIGAFVSVGAGAKVGARTALFEGVRLYEGATVGIDCVLHANVVIRERCVVGNRVILASGVAIGTDGFGYRPSSDGRGIAKVPHIGNVVIEDDVEIGANSCVDRGKFGATRIGMGSKIDNVCQIGHNVEIGRFVVMSGMTGVAGSTRIGDGCRIGGGCGIADHLTIGRGVSLAARSGVMSDIPDGATWGGIPAQDLRHALREIALIRKLPEWHRQLKHFLEAPKDR